jgi:hypothetical protein
MTNRFSTDGIETHGDPSPIDFEREGYDGPEPGNVTDFPKAPLFRTPIAESPAAPRPRVNKEYTALINAAMDVLSARLHCLIAVIGAVIMFGYAVYDPIPWRTYTVAAYACVVLFPTIWLQLKKG